MPHVVAPYDCGRFTGGVLEFDVEADSIRRLIAEMEARFPGFGEHIDQKMAVVIDGEIHQDAWGTPLAPGAEVYLIPKIGGG